MDVDRTRLDVGVVPPEPREDGVARDDSRAIADEVPEQVELPLRQPHGPAVHLDFEARAYVDTGPVQERVYAQYAGLGWIGKNTCVINPEIGSWLFLSEIICSVPLEPDVPALDQCGTCRLCIDSCPTGAIVAPYVLDATRCLSYVTIELKGEIPIDQRESLGNHAYGCDVCQEVCPWNALAPVSSDAAWRPRSTWDAPRLVSLLQLSEDELQRALKGSAMARAKPTGVRRNVQIALDNAVESASATQPSEGGR